MTNPNLQTKMQNELDRVIGNENRVTLNDKPNLPYVSAVINVSSKKSPLTNFLGNPTSMQLITSESSP